MEADTVQLDCACLLRRSRIKGWCETNLTILSIGLATKNIMNHRSANAVGVSHRGLAKKILLFGRKWVQDKRKWMCICVCLCRNIFSPVCCSARSVASRGSTSSDFAQQSCEKWVNRRSSDPYIRIESAVWIVCFCVCGSVCACLCGTWSSCCHKDHHHHHHHHRYYHPCWIEPQRFVNVQGAKCRNNYQGRWRFGVLSSFCKIDIILCYFWKLTSQHKFHWEKPQRLSVLQVFGW